MAEAGGSGDVNKKNSVRNQNKVSSSRAQNARANQGSSCGISNHHPSGLVSTASSSRSSSSSPRALDKNPVVASPRQDRHAVVNPASKSLSKPHRNREPENDSKGKDKSLDVDESCNLPHNERAFHFGNGDEANNKKECVGHRLQLIPQLNTVEAIAGVAGTQAHVSAGIHYGAYNWQASKDTIKDRFAHLLQSKTRADVEFRVGRGTNVRTISAHKFVLSMGSAVFDAMFNGGMAITSEQEDIPDVEPAAFENMMTFLYTDDVTIEPDTVMTTLYTAKKYAIPALEKRCVEFLKVNLSCENAFMLLTQARLFDEPQLAALCLDTIDRNTSEGIGAEGFVDIDLETLCVVLERDTLGIREEKLFTAVSKWAEAECNRQNLANTPANQRQVLDKAMDLIRFPLMNVEEFAQGAAQSGILTDREVVELFLHYTVNPKPAVPYNDTPRCCLTGKEQVVSRFCQIESRWGYSGTSDRIRFMVNRRIYVVGFGLYGSIHGPSEYTCNIQIIHTDQGKISGQADSTFQSDGSTQTFRVMFKEPIEIHPNISYTACSTLKGPDSFYGTKGLRKVTHESVNSGKVTFQFTYAAGNNNGTSVEDGQLPEIIFFT